MLRCTSDEAGFFELYKQLTDMRMAPVNMQGHTLVYDYDEFVQKKNYLFFCEQKAILDKFVLLSDALKDAIDVFMADNPSEKFYLDSNKLDLWSTQVYLEGKTIMAILYVRIVDDDICAVPAMYLNSALKFEQYIPLLYVAGIRKAKEENPNAKKLILSTSRENEYNGLKKVYGEPEAEEYAWYERWNILKKDEEWKKLGEYGISVLD